MGDKIKLAAIALCFLAVGHLEYRDEQNQKKLRAMVIKQEAIERDMRYWVPAPTCTDCHTTRKTKGGR